MKTLVKDVSHELPVKIGAALSNLDRNYDGGALILIGHGSGEDFMGLTSGEILKSRLKIKVLWFYACNCGQRMIRGFAGSGIIAVGHSCHILRFQMYDLALDALTRMLEQSGPDITCRDLMSSIRVSWYDTAMKCLARRDLLFASITNQLRLSMRCSS